MEKSRNRNPEKHPGSATLHMKPVPANFVNKVYNFRLDFAIAIPYSTCNTVLHSLYSPPPPPQSYLQSTTVLLLCRGCERHRWHSDPRTDLQVPDWPARDPGSNPGKPGRLLFIKHLAPFINWSIFSCPLLFVHNSVSKLENILTKFTKFTILNYRLRTVHLRSLVISVESYQNAENILFQESRFCATGYLTEGDAGW